MDPRPVPHRLSRALPLLLAVVSAALAACGDTPSEPSGKPDPDPYRFFREERLLGDAELATPEDPDAPTENPAWASWVEANHHPVRSLVSRDHADLQFLKPLLQGKRIVQLGESSHGAAEFNALKVRLVRFLHEELGYNVIAFESGLYECYHADRRIPELPPEEVMRNCTFGVWHTQEVLPLFDHIRQSRAGGRPLALAGVDVQASSARGARTRSEFLRKVVAAIDPARAQRVFDTDTALLAVYTRAGQGVPPTAVPRRLGSLLEEGGFAAAYDSLASYLDRNRERLAAAHPEAPEAPRVARQAAWSVAQHIRVDIAFARSQAATDPEEARRWSRESWTVRDRGMADNLDFLLDVLHPGKKVIVWAHNAHVRHDNAATELIGSPRPQWENMGSWVARRHRPELYTIGMYMYRGRTAANDRVVLPVAPNVSGSLESVLSRARRRFHFVDFSTLRPEEGNAWMSQRTTGREGGTSPLRLVPAAQYNAVLFVDETHAPRFLPL